MRSTNAVLYFWTTLATIFLTSVICDSSRCISCPCGSSSQNVTYCFQDTLDQPHTCESWTNCQTCEESTIFCSSCPSHRFGNTCSGICGRIPQRSCVRPVSTTGAGDWPWTMGIAALRSDDVENVFCGGVIVDKKTVLTAAQCATGASNILLLFGTAYPTPTGDSRSEQKRRISRIILHPEFDNETKNNDLALLKFEPQLNFTETIQPICLPDINSSARSLIPEQKGLVLGWGDNYTMFIYIPTLKYQSGKVSIQPNDRCEVACRKHGMSSCSNGKTFCADYPSGVDACMYRGAPMVTYDDETNRYTLAGLVTRKLNPGERKCRRGEMDTILTNVSHFMPFVLQNVS